MTTQQTGYTCVVSVRGLLKALLKIVNRWTVLGAADGVERGAVQRRGRRSGGVRDAGGAVLVVRAARRDSILAEFVRDAARGGEPETVRGSE